MQRAWAKLCQNKAVKNAIRSGGGHLLVAGVALPSPMGALGSSRQAGGELAFVTNPPSCKGGPSPARGGQLVSTT